MTNSGKLHRTLRNIVLAAGVSVAMFLTAAGVLVLSGATRQSSATDKNSTPGAQAKPAEAPLSGEMVIEPEDVAKAIQSSSAGKPLVIQVGFHILYTQAHIPGSEYLGPASKEDGMQLLKKGLATVPRNKFIVLYCGCCPWTHCPNVKPAYEALHAMGFTNVKVMHVDDNLGTNWVNKGYPVAKGD